MTYVNRLCAHISPIKRSTFDYTSDQEEDDLEDPTWKRSKEEEQADVRFSDSTYRDSGGKIHFLVTAEDQQRIFGVQNNVGHNRNRFMPSHLQVHVPVLPLMCYKFRMQIMLNECSAMCSATL